MFRNNEMKRFGTIFDVDPDLDSDTAVRYVLELADKQAEEQNLEVVAMARAEKMTFYNEELDEYETVYLTPFEQVSIYHSHPPRRFKDIGNAE